MRARAWGYNRVLKTGSDGSDGSDNKFGRVIGGEYA